MERLTMTSDKGGLAFTFDLDFTCQPSEARKILALGEHLKAYEDTGLEPSEIIELCDMDRRAKMADLLRLEQYRALGTVEDFQRLVTAQNEGRLVMVPDGYDRAEEFYHVVNVPRVCHEDHCENCKYSAEDDCKFKPHIVRLSPQRVWAAMYDLFDLKLTREEAAEALAKEDTASDE